MSLKTDLFNQLVSRVTETDQSLTLFTPIKDMPDTEPWTTIKLCLENENLHVRIMGVLMNGVATSKKRQFLLSRRFLEKYIQDFSDIEPMIPFPKSLNGSRSNRILNQLCTSDVFLKCVREATKTVKNDFRAGMYEINHSDFSNYFPWWNKKGPNTEVPTPSVPTRVPSAVPTQVPPPRSHIISDSIRSDDITDDRRSSDDS